MDKTKEFRSPNKELLSFDPIILIRDVLKRWFLIIVITVFAGVAAYIVTDQTYKPVYQTNTTLVVTTRGSTGTVYSNLASTTNLASVFTELLNSSVLQNNILEQLGMNSFDGTITATAITETNLLYLQVTANNPRTAFLVTQAIVDNHETLTYQVIGDVVVEVLQKPTVPIVPINHADAKRQMMRVMMIAAIAACILIAALSYFRDTVRSKQEAESKLDCWCLGEIHHEKKNKTLLSWIRHKKSSIVITNPTTSFSYVETIRKLRRRIEQHMSKENVIMVTSLLENEGKSTVAVNIALAMAQKHDNVLLIDCDLHRPACRKILDHEWEGAETKDVINGDAQLKDAVTIDELSGLNLLLERKGDRNASDITSSSGFADLINEASDRYDFVVLDLPPMSVTSDAEAIMEYADASILVVQQNTAHARALNKVVNVLQSGKAKLLGCVLNNVYSSAITSGGNYSGRRRYGKYGKYGKYGRYGKYGYGQYGANAQGKNKE